MSGQYEFGDDFITITDEDGNEYELEVLDIIEYQGTSYLALVPADADEDAELEVSILKQVEDENGEEILETIDDDAELETVYQILMDKLYEEDDTTEEEPV